MDDITRFPGGIDVDHDPETGAVAFEYDWNYAEPLSTLVAVGVATVMDAAPTEIPPISTAVDPDALETLFAPTRGGRPRSDGRLAFELAEAAVEVRADGQVEITPPE